MNRRTVLRGAAVAAGSATATLAGLHVADDASAQASAALEIGGDSVVLDAGTIAAVTLDATVEWAYELPDGTQPSTVGVELGAAEAGSELQAVASAESAEIFLDADGSESFSVDLLAEGALAASDLTPDAGGTRDTAVDVEPRMWVANSGGDRLAEASSLDTATLTVDAAAHDASQYGAVGGTGGLTITLD